MSKVEITTVAVARAALQAAGETETLSDASEVTLLLRDAATDRATGILQLEQLPFDTKLFGVPMARIGLLKAPDETGYRQLLSRCEEECRKRGVRRLIRRLPVGRFEEAWALAGHAQRLVDVSVLFEQDLPAERAADVPGVRPVHPEEHEGLATKYASSFTLTRFAVDPLCSREAATELHRQWLLNSCRGRADAVLVAEGPEGLDGFVTCRVDATSRTGTIELIAVDTARRGAGIGKRLVAAALAWFRGRVAKVQVRTQLNNTVATALYQASGFRLKLGELTYSGEVSAK